MAEASTPQVRTLGSAAGAGAGRASTSTGSERGTFEARRTFEARWNLRGAAEPPDNTDITDLLCHARPAPAGERRRSPRDPSVADISARLRIRPIHCGLIRGPAGIDFVS
ncbi:hypothetical protein GCM10023322_44140 [Rugosimonospora acidiphila]|uniref:Uncharacterized protein n=1 Tax=Rugosimonospora acidiphila TaxID=556531 RepID=A0ABP9S279_9ACTN